MQEHRPALEGKFVSLRAHEPADIAELNELFNDPEVGEGVGMWMPQPTQGFAAFVEATAKDPTKAAFVIERLEDRAAIGGCSLFDIALANRTAGLGIWLGKPYWDSGYGTDAVRTLCRFGFEHMNLQRIELNVFATNPRARRAYEKVGFVLEGERRRSEFIGGQYVNSYVMALLAEELAEQP